MDDLRSVEGVGEPRLMGGSVGAELAQRTYWESTARAGDRTARARLFAVEDPAAARVWVGRKGEMGNGWSGANRSG